MAWKARLGCNRDQQSLAFNCRDISNYNFHKKNFLAVEFKTSWNCFLSSWTKRQKSLSTATTFDQAEDSVVWGSEQRAITASFSKERCQTMNWYLSSDGSIGKGLTWEKVFKHLQWDCCSTWRTRRQWTVRYYIGGWYYYVILLILYWEVDVIQIPVSRSNNYYSYLNHADIRHKETFNSGNELSFRLITPILIDMKFKTHHYKRFPRGINLSFLEPEENHLVEEMGMVGRREMKWLNFASDPTKLKERS